MEGPSSANIPNVLDFYKNLSSMSRSARDSQTEGENVEKIDFWAAVDSFLSSVKGERREPVDIGDEAILRRFRSTANLIKQYKEAMNDTKSDDDDDDDDDDDKGEETAVAEEPFPVPAVSARAEKLLRSARTLHQQTAELRSFLKDLLSEEEPAERVGPPSCPDLEEPSVRKMLSPSRKIAEEREELELEEEYPAAVCPSPIRESLDHCIQIISGVKANDEQCSDLSPSESGDAIG